MTNAFISQFLLMQFNYFPGSVLMLTTSWCLSCVTFVVLRISFICIIENFNYFLDNLIEKSQVLALVYENQSENFLKLAL